MVAGWKHALENGKSLKLSEPGLRFPAFVQGRGEGARIEIGSVSKSVDELSASDVAKIVKNCINLAAELEPVLLGKTAAEKQATPDAEGKRVSPGDRRLIELGVAGEDADADDSDEDEIDAAADEEDDESEDSSPDEEVENA